MVRATFFIASIRTFNREEATVSELRTSGCTPQAVPLRLHPLGCIPQAASLRLYPLGCTPQTASLRLHPSGVTIACLELKWANWCDVVNLACFKLNRADGWLRDWMGVEWQKPESVIDRPCQPLCYSTIVCGWRWMSASAISSQKLTAGTDEWIWDLEPAATDKKPLVG